MPVERLLAIAVLSLLAVMLVLYLLTGSAHAAPLPPGVAWK